MTSQLYTGDTTRISIPTASVGSHGARDAGFAFGGIIMPVKEKELEDYICNYPEMLLPGLRIIKRQASVYHGIIDIVAWQDYLWKPNLHIQRPVVIELKAGIIRDKDVT